MSLDLLQSRSELMRTRKLPSSSTSPVENLKETEQADIVIIGNGIAGLSAALKARRLDEDVRIVIVTEQRHPTLLTPALKDFLARKLRRSQLLAYPLGIEQQQHIALSVAHVEQIQSSNQRVVLSNGSTLGYHSLLLATGSVPKGLPEHLPGRDFDGVVTAHELRSYLDLRRRLYETQQAIVVGGGAHGLETVMALLAHGIGVHWLIRSPTCLPHYLDETASHLVIDRVCRAGGQVTTEVELLSIVGTVGAVVGVRTTKQDFLPCQVVVACTGTLPRTELATHCDQPLHCHEGILVDEQFRTNVPSIYAAGDVAEILDTQTQPQRQRGIWDNVEAQGKLAAAAMMGNTSSSRLSLRSPTLSTEVGQFEILVVGNPLGFALEVSDPDEPSPKRVYQRVARRRNRIIGFLWVGPKVSCPDPLPIQLQIDQDRHDAHETRVFLHGDPATEPLSELCLLWDKARRLQTEETIIETFGAEEGGIQNEFVAFPQAETGEEHTSQDNEDSKRRTT